MMQCVAWLLFFLLGCQALCAQSAPPLIVRHVTVIDATGAPPRQDQRVRIELGRIVSVGPDTGPVPAHAVVLNGSGKFLIPGLWDMHTHLSIESWREHGSSVLFPMLIANGVTGVRDMGGYIEVLQKWRAQIGTGTIVGPTIFAAGPTLNGMIPFKAGWHVSLSNAQQAREAVRSVRPAGGDFIKVSDLLPRDAYFAIIDEARRLGMPVAGHVPFAITAAEASDAGQKSIEHLTGLDISSSREESALRLEAIEAGRHEEYLTDLVFIKAFQSFDQQKFDTNVEHYVRNRTWQTPTLTVLRPSSCVENESSAVMKYVPLWQRNLWKEDRADFHKTHSAEDIAELKKFFQLRLEWTGALGRAGVSLLAGTDAPNDPACLAGFSLHDELELLVQAGVKPMDALIASTRNPAEYLGVLQDRGTVEAGKAADLLLLNANPLDDIRNTKKIEAVILNGRLFRRRELDRMLSSAAARARESKASAQSHE